MTLSTASLFVLALATANANAAAGALPLAVTDADQLTTKSLRHHEVLRIGRDFGKPQFEIAVDTWSLRKRPDEIRDVRIWWVRTDRDDRRSPFGKRLRRYLELEFDDNAHDDWTVKMRGDRKEFAFDVELDDEGRAAAYATVVTDAGTRVGHCRASSGTLVARRFLGIPVGIEALRVRCIDDDGNAHAGEVPYRKLRWGKLYKA